MGWALAWGALEQGAAAAVPLLTGLLAAWTLPVADHGRLAVMAGGLAAGLAIHGALVLDPLTARGRARPATLGAAAGLWLLLSAMAGMVACMVPDGLAEDAAWGVAGAAGPALLALARRIGHLRGRPGAALGAVLVAAVLTAGLTLRATTPGGFLLALAAGAAAGALPVLAGAPRWPGRRVLRAALRHHARLGGWLLVAAGPWVVATQAPLILLAAQHGEAAAGTLRGLLLLALPANHIAAAIGSVIQPRLADAARHRDVRRAALRWGGLSGLLAAPWVVVLALLPEALAGMILGAAYAAAAGPILPLLAAAALLGALGAGPALALRAARRGRAVVGATTAGAVAGVTAAALLVPGSGAGGAAVALLVARAADIAAQLALLGRAEAGRAEAGRRGAWA